MNIRPLLTMLLIGFVLGAVPSAPALSQQRVPTDLKTTTQKAMLVENLVTRSVSASRLEQSGDPQAIDALARARALVSEAQGDLSRNAVEQANDKLDQALALLNTETQRLSGAALKGERLQEEYERRHHAVATFLSAYQRVAKDDGSRSASRQADEIAGLSRDAERLAANGNYKDAIAKLEDAYTVARGDIREMRQGKTLTRTLDFETAQEEYEYELGRNRSHFVLLEFAFGENAPKGSVLSRIKGNQKEAEALLRKAESQAGSGDHATAIGTLNKSTQKLLEAIRMSGVFVPG